MMAKKRVDGRWEGGGGVGTQPEEPQPHSQNTSHQTLSYTRAKSNLQISNEWLACTSDVCVEAAPTRSQHQQQSAGRMYKYYGVGGWVRWSAARAMIDIDPLADDNKTIKSLRERMRGIVNTTRENEARILRGWMKNLSFSCYRDFSPSSSSSPFALFFWWRWRRWKRDKNIIIATSMLLPVMESPPYCILQHREPGGLIIIFRVRLTVTHRLLCALYSPPPPPIHPLTHNLSIFNSPPSPTSILRFFSRT